MFLAHASPAQHSRLGPPDIYPDPVRTPGAANPQVTQGNIQDNICNPEWSTKLIRPPSEYTSRLKRKKLREYGDTVHQTRAELINPATGKVDTTRCVAHSDNMACYEEDHLIPLEDGGDPTDPRNLWPEAYNTRGGGVIMGAHQKDVVEAFIHESSYRASNHLGHPEARPGDSLGRLVRLLRVDKEGRAVQVRP
jgi:hypothetical protein